jgi:hypothetical protein
MRRDSNDAGIGLGAYQRPKMPDILRQDNPSQCCAQTVDDRISDVWPVEVMFDMLKVK